MVIHVSFEQDSSTPDFTIKTRNAVFKVHKAVLSSQSGYFRALWRDSFSESEQKSIEYPEHDSKLFHLMVTYMYHPTREEDWQTEKQNSDFAECGIKSDIASRFDLLHFADEWQCTGLIDATVSRNGRYAQNATPAGLAWVRKKVYESDELRACDNDLKKILR